MQILSKQEVLGTLCAMIKQPLKPEVLDHLAHIPGDMKESYLLGDGQIRLTAIAATRLVCEMQANFQTGVLETLVLGKAFIAALAMASSMKGNDRLKLTVECGGPIGGYSAEAWASGAVRGSLVHNPIPLAKPLKDANLSPLYGPGFLTVTRLIEGEREPVSGQIMIEYGNLAKDLALYYHQSEQIFTLIDLSIQFDKAGNPSGCGGLLFQVMPDCSEEAIGQLEDLSTRLKPLGAWLEAGLDMQSYVEAQCAGLKPKHLASGMVGFSCPCSKEAFAEYLKNLPSDTRKDILKNGPFPLPLTCGNCGSRYTFEKETLERLLNDPADKEKK